MKIVNCTWELKNLGERVVEIEVNKDDVFNAELLLNSIKDFDYMVVKVPMNMSSFNIGLSKLGFTMIETQMMISKSYNSFDFSDRLIKHIYPHIWEKEILTEGDFEEMISKIDADMFTTDRIYIDPYFSKESSRNRYVNWMRTEFEKRTSIFSEIIYDDISIGMGMKKEISSGVFYGSLGGVYKEYASEGHGLAMATTGMIMAHKRNKPIKKVLTAISSNNVPMLQIYNYLNYKIEKMFYVFIKHL